MLFKPNLVAAAVAFGVISGTTAVAADDKPIQNDLSNDAQPLVTGPKLHEGMKHAGAGLRIAYRRLIAAAAEDSEDPEEIEWGDAGGCGGINCDGTGDCTFFVGALDVIEEISKYANSIDFKRTYTNGEKIMCAEGGAQTGCVELRDVSHPLNGFEIYTLFKILENHGCHNCGNVPVRLIRDGVNDRCNPSGELFVGIPDNDDDITCVGIC